jgi:cytochrome c biogenesis protein CcdA/thiol-disulfide isomerase/thioredoxin
LLYTAELTTEIFMLLLLGFSFLAGIFTAFSPCILPLLPAILAAGASGGRLRPLGTILGLICSFSFFTLALSWIVHETGLSAIYLRYVAIVLVFFFALVMIFPKLSTWFAKLTAPFASLGQKIQGTTVKPGFWKGMIFGAALGLLWTPCAGPILGAITTLVATRALNTAAVLMTIAYSTGAGIPMFIFAYGSAKLIQTSHFLSQYAEKIRQFFGVLMLLFAVFLTFNWELLLNEKLSRLVPEFFSEKNFSIEKELSQVKTEKHFLTKAQAPPLTRITGWINSPPLSLSNLRGHVVLIDFWTYSCINCLRTLPHLKNWYRDYKNYGLVIIGVHTPEFEFEKDDNNVSRAVKRLGIDYPVALDNDYQTWNAYYNHYWPADYLIDQEGIIRRVHFGEGDYVETENAIRMLLGLAPLQMLEKAHAQRPLSPEIYLGTSRARSYDIPITPQETADYAYTAPLRDDQVGLKGLWLAEEEDIQAMADNSYLDCNFLATRVYLVLSGSSATPLEIYLDGAFYGHLSVDGDRKYDIVRTSYKRHQLSLKVPVGIKAYAFTFGDE